MTDEFRPTIVYLVAHAGPKAPVKVGYSTSAEKRLGSLQTGNPTRLEIVAKLTAPTVPIARYIEARFHEFGAKHRLSGEWFDMSPADALNLLTKVVMATIVIDIERSEVDLSEASRKLQLLMDFAGVPEATECWQRLAAKESVDG